MRRGLRSAVLAACLTASAAFGAGPYDTGQAAFVAQDYLAAALLWQAEAAAGSPDAAFGLGLINDLGLGQLRNAAKARAWYLDAARLGSVEGAFNAGVMFDAGSGGPQDVAAAADLYGRAAANGNARAEYNLALLYLAGDGVPRNVALARVWLDRASGSLPAARDRLGQLPAATGAAADAPLVPPVPRTGTLAAGGAAVRADLVWTAAASAPAARFLVEVLETGGAPVIAGFTDASAAAVALTDPGASYAWRVSQIDASGAHYAAGPWWPIGRAAAPSAYEAPAGRILLEVGAEDAPAARFADELADGFRAAGYWVRTVPATPDAAAGTAVRYGFVEDAGLAADVAAFLPGLGRTATERIEGTGLGPGEIAIELVGGPS